MYITKITIGGVEQNHFILDKKQKEKQTVIFWFSNGKKRHIRSYRQFKRLSAKCYGVSCFKNGDYESCVAVVYNEIKYNLALGVGTAEEADVCGFEGVDYSYAAYIRCFENGVVICGSDVYTTPDFIDSCNDAFVRSYAHDDFGSLKLHVEGGYFYYSKLYEVYRVRLSYEVKTWLAKRSFIGDVHN